MPDVPFTIVLTSEDFYGIEIRWLFRENNEYRHSVQKSRDSAATQYFFVRPARGYVAVALDNDKAIAAVLSEEAATLVPAAYNQIPRYNATIDEALTDDMFIVAVEYSFGNEDPDGENDSDHSFTFETSTFESVRRKSYQTTEYVSSEKSNGIINDGEGVSVKFPVASFSETHYFGNSAFGQSKRNDLLGCTGKINSGTFRGWPARCVMFTGCNGSRNGTKSTDKWQVTFNFSVRPSETVSGLKYVDGSDVEHTLNDFDVAGWDYLWFRFGHPKRLTNDLNKHVRPIKGVFVSRVYATADFSSVLGI